MEDLATYRVSEHNLLVHISTTVQLILEEEYLSEHVVDKRKINMYRSGKKQGIQLRRVPKYAEIELKLLEKLFGDTTQLLRHIEELISKGRCIVSPTFIYKYWAGILLINVVTVVKLYYQQLM
jgi:hypothetical protein